ncbi:GntR family transcriptional regulator [Salinarimonas sp.]|uniref:GntR family transcriptional regulator n=1 Tax=Salinarimonas sp. TaxID=2766526 RepID=UPI0032D974D8
METGAKATADGKAEGKTSVEPSKTRRLYLLLRDRIVGGALAAGARLPSEPELSAAHGVSRVTVRRALDGLEQDGLIRRQPGAGTFVIGKPGREAIVADFSNMLAHLVEMGRSTSVRLLSFGYETPAPAVADALKLEDGARTQRSVRVRYIDGAPFSHLTTWVPERIGVTYSEADLATTPLLALLERSGVTTERASQTIGATLAGPEAAEALEVDVGSALLSLARTVFDEAGRGVEHLHALYRPDRYAFRMELMRIGRDGARRWSPVATTNDEKTRENETGRDDRAPQRGDLQP